jgi:hypothetical protein
MDTEPRRPEAASRAVRGILSAIVVCRRKENSKIRL